MVRQTNLLVTGSDGQLGKCLKKISSDFNNYNFFFKKKNELDISDDIKLDFFVKRFNINCIINCAAYTDVIHAENNKDVARKVNIQAVDNISKICQKHNIQLIHISTDFIFDGKKKSFYNELDMPNPLNFYGYTKLEGEKKMKKYKLNKSIIIRTSWLYSNHENCFVNKVLRFLETKNIINVVSDEYGSPTNAFDLAYVILEIIPKLSNRNIEVYNYSNLGYCSRYHFALKIKEYVKGNSQVNSIISNNARVIRPKFTPLDSNKLIKHFDIKIKDWKTSLRHFLKNEVFS